MSFVRITNKSWYNPQKGDWTETLAANILNNVNYSFHVEIETVVKLSPFTWSFSAPPQYIKRDDGGSWLNDGFQEGDDIHLIAFTDSSSFSSTGTVTFVSDDEIAYSGADVDDSVKDGDLIIYNKTTLNSLFYKDNLVDNSSTAENYIDKVTGNERSYYIENITTSIVKMKVNGSKDGYSASKYINSIGVIDVTINTPIGSITVVGAIQVFRIHSYFRLTPQLFNNNNNYYDVENIVNPPQYFGDKSLKYIFQTEFRDVYSNPNSPKVFSFAEDKASIGWYNENYNGFPNNYLLNSITFINDTTSLPVTGLEAEEQTRVEIEIDSVLGTFANGQPITLFHSIFPSSNTYQNSIEGLDSTFLIRDTRIEIGTTLLSEPVFGDVTVLLVSSSKIRINFITDYTTDEKNKISDDIKYSLSVQLSNDANADPRQDDQTNILVNYDNFIKSDDVDGLISLDSFRFSDSFNSNTPFDNINGWIEDGCFVDFTFRKKTNTSLTLYSTEPNIYDSIRIDKIRLELVAVDTTKPYPIITDDWFLISSYEIDLSKTLDILKDLGASELTKVQNLDTDIDRGFPVSGVDDRYWKVKIGTETETQEDITYTLNIPFKLDWQQVNALPNIDNVPVNFQDSTQKNDGFNVKSDNYSEKDNYQVKCNVAFDVVSDGITTTYFNLSQDFKIFDYDEDETSRGGGIALWSSVIETSEQNGGDLLGKVSTSGDTLIKVIFTPSTPTVLDPLDWCGAIRLSLENQTSYLIDEIFTNRTTTNNDNSLIPLDGDSLPLWYEDNGTLVLECRTNFSKLTSGESYALTSRLSDCISVIPSGAYSDAYSNAYN